MVERELFDNLCLSLQGYIKELQDAQDIDWQTFVQDNRSRRFIERVLQILIESMIDLGQHIIADEGLREPRTYRDVFKILTENGVLKSESLPVFEKIAAFRNVLVHQYEKVDDAIVYGVFKKNLLDLEEFLAQVITWYQEKESQK